MEAGGVYTKDNYSKFNSSFVFKCDIHFKMYFLVRGYKQRVWGSTCQTDTFVSNELILEAYSMSEPLI